MKDKLFGLAIAAIWLFVTFKLCGLAYDKGRRDANKETEAYWTTAIVKSGAGKWVIRKGEALIVFRRVPFKPRKVVEFRDGKGKLIKEGDERR